MLNPITAVTDTNPYPFYAGLVRRHPLYYDRELTMWVASGFDVVESILKNPDCRVRPAAEPVPHILRDTAAGEIFRHLVRMTDGAGHCPLKWAVSKTIDEIDHLQIADESARQADLLFDELKNGKDFDCLTDFAFRLPIYVLGRLTGLSQTELHKTQILMSAFVRCLAPGSTADQITAGIAAAPQLIDIFEQADDPAAENIFSRLVTNSERAGILRREIAVFNMIGLFFQSYEATAGLIGNALVTLAAHPAHLKKIEDEPGLLHLFLNEVERFDSPIQNTRRFTTAETLCDGQRIKAGETILLILAAANWDPAANPDPDVFNPTRNNSRSLTFGTGPHACPGRNLAVTIAAAGLHKLIFSGLDLSLIGNNLIYRDSANTRIPLSKGEKVKI